jgi:hypothetical protein
MRERDVFVGADPNVVDVEYSRLRELEENIPSFPVSVDAHEFERFGHVVHHDVSRVVGEDGGLKTSLA